MRSLGRLLLSLWAGLFLVLSASAQATDDCASAPQVGDGVHAFSTLTATGSPAASCGWGDTYDVWYKYTPTVSGLLSATLCNVTGLFGSTIAIYSACGGTELDCRATEDDCNTMTQWVAVGSSYWVRLAGEFNTQGTGTLTLRCNGADDCAQATPIDIGTYRFRSDHATGTDITSCGHADDRDVWFRYTATSSGILSLSVCNSLYHPTLAIFSSCGGTELACSNSGSAGCVTRLEKWVTSGSSYLVRASAEGGGALDDLQVALLQDQSRDVCADAITATDGAYVFSTANATGTDLTSCGTADTRDVWFSYTAPITGLFTASTCGSADHNTTLALFSGCGGSELACNDDGVGCGSGTSKLMHSVIAGTTYRVRVGAASGQTGAGTVHFSCIPHLSADACAAALPIGNEFLQFSTHGSTGTDLTNCTNGDSKDVWYSYTATCSGVLTVSTCDLADFNTSIALFASCSGPQLACNDDGNGCSDGSSTLEYPVQSGTTLLIRVSGANGQTGTGWITVSCAATQPQDICADAMPITNGIHYFDHPSATGTDVSSCGSNDAVDVWYRYMPSYTGTATASTCGTTSYATTLSVFDGCGGMQLACSSSSPGCTFGATIGFSVTAGATYYLRVAGYSSISAIGAVVVGGGPTPPNDECLTAVTLTPSQTCTPTAATVTGATPSAQPGSCNGFTAAFGNDVWFKFVAAQTNYVLQFDGAANPALMVHVRQGACNGTSVACTVGDGVSELGDLSVPTVIGQTYYIRVNSALTIPLVDGSFTICLTMPTEVCDGIDNDGDGFTDEDSPDTDGDGFADCIDQCDNDPYKWVPGVCGCGEPDTDTDGDLAADCEDPCPLLAFKMPGDPCDDGIASTTNDAVNNFCECVGTLGNDECANAVTIGNGSHPFSTIGATGTDITASCGWSDTRDIWFRYTADCTGLLTATTCGSVADVISLFASCGGAELACQYIGPDCATTGEAFRHPVVAGTTYLLRVAGSNGSSGMDDGTLTISCTPWAASDDCASAMTITTGGLYPASTYWATGNDLTPGCGTNDTKDIWYRYIAECKGEVLIHTGYEVPDFNTTLAVYDACGGNMITCNDDNPGVWNGESQVTFLAEPGDAFWIRVSGVGKSEGYCVLSINCRQLPADECADATTIGEGQHSCDTDYATGTDITSCGSGDSKDIWYRYVPQCTGVATVNACGAISFHAILGIYSDCGITPIMCSDEAIGCIVGIGSEAKFPVVAGTPYWVRIAGADGTSGIGSFFIACSPTPENDVCSQAIPVVSGPNGFETTAATGTDITGCVSGDAKDVWYSYTASCTGEMTLEAIVEAGQLMSAALFDQCGGPELACAASASTTPYTASLQHPVTAGHTYLIRLAAGNQLGLRGVFGIACTPYASADLCANAMPIGNGVFPFDNHVPISADLTSCVANDTRDVWYKYTSICTGRATANMCNDATISTSIGVFSACGGSEIACVGGGGNGSCGYGAGPVTFPVTAGTTYWIRIAGLLNGQGTGELTIHCVDTPPNDACATATTLTPGSTCTTTSGTLLNADQSLPPIGCGGFQGSALNDVWYRFMATAAASHTVTVAGNTGLDPIIDIRTGACTGTNIACADATAQGGVESVTFNTTPGQVYLIRVYNYETDLPPNPTFTICVSYPPVEICDGIDNDGDGQIDEGFPNFDGDAAADCVDECPYDPNKTVSGACGCFMVDTDTDNDGIANCFDGCPTLPGQMGDACNDGNACTVDDVINVDCVCLGTIADADNDGTCDADDLCAGAEPGSPCNDGNAGTINDVVGTNCACAGTPVVISSTPPPTATEDEPYTYQAALSSNVPGASWSVSMDNTCAGSVDATTGLFTFTPLGPTPSNSCVLAIEACIPGVTGPCMTQAATITIIPVNDAPVIMDNAPTTATQDEPYFHQPIVLDMDGPDFVWSLVDNTCGATIDPITGYFSFIPYGPDPPATCTYTLRVCDTGTPELCATQTVTVNITDLPDDDDGDGVLNEEDLCPGGDDNLDTDGDGLPDFCDDCATVPGQIGSACDDGNANTTGDLLNASCQCMGTPVGNCTGQEVTVRILTDGDAEDLSWTIVDDQGSIVATGGPFLSLDHTLVSTTACLPHTSGSCYRLRITDAFGDGISGGYWEVRDTNGALVTGDVFNNGASSPALITQHANYGAGHAFCLPLGPSTIATTSCGVFTNIRQSKVYCTEVPGASTYQFEFSDPDAGFMRRIAVPRNWVRFSEMFTFPLQPGVVHLARVRVDQGLPGFADDHYGAACELGLSAETNCTALIDNPGANTHSCGSTRTFGGSSRIWAQPVNGATAYRFRFSHAATGFVRHIDRPTYLCPLNWVTAPLQAGLTYSVETAVYINGAWTPYCGSACALTIIDASSLPQQRTLAVEEEVDGQLHLWPNPNSGELFQLRSDVELPFSTTAVLEVHTLDGRLVWTQPIASADATRGLTVQPSPALAAGTYLITLRSGDSAWSTRTVVIR